jgi:DNA-binding NtrC family response regulator
MPLLAAHFVDQVSRRHGLQRPRLTRSDVERLMAYDWPGNIRELQNVIERAAIVSRGGTARLETVLQAGAPAPVPAPAAQPPALLSEAAMRERARQNLETALRESGGRIYGPGGAAARLGIKPSTLASRVKALGIRPSRGGSDERV